MKKSLLLISLLLAESAQTAAQISLVCQAPDVVTACSPSEIFTLTVRQSGNAPLTGALLRASLPTGMTYVAGSVSGASETSVGSPDSLVFLLPTLEPCRAQTVSFRAGLGCGNVAADSMTAFRATVFAGGAALEAVANRTDFLQPELEIEEISVDSQNPGVFRRHFLLTNSGSTALRSAIEIFEKTTAAGYAVLAVSPGVSLDAGTEITLPPDFFRQFGNHDALLHPGETLDFWLDVAISRCEKSDSDMEIRWGCPNDSPCAAHSLARTFSPGVNAGQTFYLSFNFLKTASFCSAGEQEVWFVNPWPRANQFSDANQYDLVFDLRHEDSLQTPPCLTFFNFSVGGMPLAPSFTGISVFRFDFSGFVADPDGPGGLSDLDGDGHFNDLAPGDTLRFRFNTHFDAACLKINCSSAWAEDARLGFQLRFEDACGNIRETANHWYTGIYVGQQQTVLPWGLCLNAGQNTLNLSFYRPINLSGLCDSSAFETRLLLPPGATLAPGAVVTMNSEKDTIPHFFTGDTLVLRHRNHFTGTFNIPVEHGCDPAFFGSDGKGYFSGISFTLDWICHSACGQKKLPLFCGQTHGYWVYCSELDQSLGNAFGHVMKLDSFAANRRNLGWTDATQTTRATPQTPGIRLNHALFLDTLSLDVRSHCIGGQTIGGNGLFLHVKYLDDNVLDEKKLPFIQPEGGARVRFFEHEFQTWVECPNVPLSNEQIVNGNHSFDLALTPLFLPGSCFSGRVFDAGDSIWVEIPAVVALDPKSSDYELRDFTANFYPQPSHGCGEELRSAALHIFQRREHLSLVFFDNSGFLNFNPFQPNCEILPVRSVISGVSPDAFPAEHRPISRVDSLEFEFDARYDFHPDSFIFLKNGKPFALPPGIFQKNTNGAAPGFYKLTLTNPAALPLTLADGEWIEMLHDLPYLNCQTAPPPLVIHARNKTTGMLHLERPDLQTSNAIARTDTLKLRSLELLVEPKRYNFIRPDTATFVLELRNPGFVFHFDTVQAPAIHHVWLAFELDLNVQIIGFEEITDSTAPPVALPLLSYGPGKFWAKLGDMPFANVNYLLLHGLRNPERHFRLRLLPRDCDDHEVLIRQSYRCSDYPPNPDTPTCTAGENHTLLLLRQHRPILKTKILAAPALPLAPCEPFSYDLKINNLGWAEAGAPKVWVQIPPGLSLVSAEFRSDSPGLWQPLPAPVLMGQKARLELSGLLPGGIFSQQGSLGKSGGWARLHFQPACDFRGGPALVFHTSGLAPCGAERSGERVGGEDLAVAVDTNFAANRYAFGLQIRPAGDGCAQNLRCTLALRSLGGLSGGSVGGEKIRLVLDPDLAFVPGSTLGLKNFPGNPQPQIFAHNADQTALEWDMPPGIFAGDSVVFSIETENRCGSPCGELALRAECSSPLPNICAGLGCAAQVVRSARDFAQKALRPVFVFENATLSQALGDDRFELAAAVRNLTDVPGGGLLTLEFFHDQNGNGVFDETPNEQLGAFQFPGTVLGPNATVWQRALFDWPDSVLCKVLIVMRLEANPCLCEGAETTTVLRLGGFSKDTFACAGATITLGPQPRVGWQYAWSPPQNLSDPNAANPLWHNPGAAIGTDTLLLRATLPGGCTTATDTIFIKKHAVEIALRAGPPPCPGVADGVVFLEKKSPGGNALHFFWSDGSNATADSLAGLAPGFYAVTATDALGCSDTASVSLAERRRPEVVFDVTDATCAGASDGAVRALDEPPGGHVFRLNGGPFSAENATIEGLSAGDYSVTVRDSVGCVFEGYGFSVAENLPLWLDACCDTLIWEGDSVQLTSVVPAVAGLRFRWSPARWLDCDTCPHPRARPLESTVFQLTLTDADGCTAEGRVAVEVKNQLLWWAPNAIRPDGNDGAENSVFCLFANRFVQKIKVLQIFDRWGTLVFERRDFAPNDPALGWDGVFRGRAVNPAVFGFWAELELTNGKTEVAKGDLTVVR